MRTIADILADVNKAVIKHYVATEGDMNIVLVQDVKENNYEVWVVTTEHVTRMPCQTLEEAHNELELIARVINQTFFVNETYNRFIEIDPDTYEIKE